MQRDSTMLAVVLLVALIAVACTVYPSMEKTWEKANKAIANPSGQAVRL